MYYTWKEKGFKERACKENPFKKSRTKYERVSGRKSSPGGSGESWFHSKSYHSRNGNGGWETKGPLIK